MYLWKTNHHIHFVQNVLFQLIRKFNGSQYTSDSSDEWEVFDDVDDAATLDSVAAAKRSLLWDSSGVVRKVSPF